MNGMLLGLVCRGVAFEFRWRHERHRAAWDIAFTAGSLVATMAQGMVLGAILQGVRVSDNAYAGGWLDWLSPFSLLTGVSLVVGYSLLGATWLVWKTDGDSQRHARRLAFGLGIAMLIAIAAVSAATPFLHYAYWRRWFGVPGLFLTAPIPLLVLAAGFYYFRALARNAEVAPFLIALALFFLGFVGLGVSIFPFIIPASVTIWDAAAPEQSQVFVLIGAVIIIPIILIYTSWAYWVFRGKVDAQGYH